MNKYRLAFLLILSIETTVAQTIDKQRERESFADSVLNIATNYSYSNPDSCLYYNSIIQRYARKNNLPVIEARTLCLEGQINVLRGDVESAIKSLNEAIDVFTRFHEEDLKARAINLKAIAVGKVHDSEEEINLLKQAEDIYRRTGNIDGIATVMINLACVYASIKKYDKCLEIIEASRKYVEDGSDAAFYLYLNSAIAHIAKGNYSLAQTCLDSCLHLSLKHRIVDGRVTALTVQAELYYATGKISTAIDFYKQSVAMALANKLPIEEAAALTGLLKCYRQKKDFENAFHTQHRLGVISDSLFNQEKIRRIGAIEAKLEVTKREKIIADQNLALKSKILEQEEARNKMLLLVFSASILFVTVVLTFILYFKTRKKNELIRNQKEQIEAKSKLVEQKNSKLEELNEVNQKIFAVLSHDFKEPLVSLRLLIAMARRNIDHNFSRYATDIESQLVQSEMVLHNLLGWARHQLKPNSDDSFYQTPVAHVINEIIGQLKSQADKKNIRISNNLCDEVLCKTDTEVFRIIYRNLIGNAIKFSYPNSTVECDIVESTRELYVRDYGVGIDTGRGSQLFTERIKPAFGTALERGYGLGLYMTKELIEKNGGSIRVESLKEKGTCFYFKLPLHNHVA